MKKGKVGRKSYIRIKGVVGRAVKKRKEGRREGGLADATPGWLSAGSCKSQRLPSGIVPQVTTSF